MPRRLLAAVLVAAPVLLGGCGSGGDDAAAPASPTPVAAAPSSPVAPHASPTATDGPVQQWFDAGGQATLDALARSTKLDLAARPADPVLVQAQCQQLLTDVAAAQALPPFPVAPVADELTASYPGLIAAAQRCLTEAAAGEVDALRSGLLVEMYDAIGAFQLAHSDAIVAILEG